MKPTVGNSTIETLLRVKDLIERSKETGVLDYIVQKNPDLGEQFKAAHHELTDVLRKNGVDAHSFDFEENKNHHL